MIELNERELNEIIGGGILTAAFFNAAARCATLIMDLGRRLGSSIRRIITKRYC